MSQSLAVPRFPFRLAIVSHVAHFRDREGLSAYAPYAREIELWCDLFSEVVIAAPLAVGVPPRDCAVIRRNNLEIHPQRLIGGTGFAAKVRLALQVPGVLGTLHRTLRGVEAIHVRCPGNLGLLGALMARFYSGRRIAKFAGQWSGYPGEPWSVRLQRAILGSRWWGAPVTVYRPSEDQAGQVVPFFSAALNESQMQTAREAAVHPRLRPPWRILFVGRLSRSKNVDILLQAIHRVARESFELEVGIVGDGPERRHLEELARDLSLNDLVRFHGGLPIDRVLDLYRKGSILVLVSQTEGWPKAITEAMAHGLVCVGSDRGLMPQILGDGRGLVVPAGDASALAAALLDVLRHPDQYVDVASKAAEWAQRFTLEELRDSLSALMRDSWKLSE